MNETYIEVVIQGRGARHLHETLVKRSKLRLSEVDSESQAVMEIRTAEWSCDIPEIPTRALIFSSFFLGDPA